jgi:nucleoid-associated protein YgaU
VVPRKPKLIAAGAVLMLGLALAWPWRREDAGTATLPTALPANVPEAPATPPSEPRAAENSTSLAAQPLNLEGRQQRSAFISAAHPAAEVPEIGPTPEEPGSPFVHAPTALPAEAPARTHIVHEGDSLERLAERYLGDAGRAVEIFDLNRDILENPHLLRIGAELKIPPDSNTVGL